MNNASYGWPVRAASPSTSASNGADRRFGSNSLKGRERSRPRILTDIHEGSRFFFPNVSHVMLFCIHVFLTVILRHIDGEWN
jgi:hypothetical protein